MSEKLRILLTGFGPFPGAPHNPTQPLVARLAQLRRPALDDVAIASHIFPVTYAAVDRQLPELLAKAKPDALLMFGLAARTPYLRIETRARNAVTMNKQTEMARALVKSLHEDGRLDEFQLTAFAEQGKFDETNAGLAALAGVAVETAETMPTIRKRRLTARATRRSIQVFNFLGRRQLPDAARSMNRLPLVTICSPGFRLPVTSTRLPLTRPILIWRSSTDLSSRATQTRTLSAS